MAAWSVAISPCPNDTFLFYQFIAHPESIAKSFDLHFADIQELNQSLVTGQHHFVKASFAALKQGVPYRPLSIGAALGRGCGPLVVCGADSPLEDVAQAKRVLLPGEQTTACALFRWAYGRKKEQHLRFDGIADHLKDEKDAVGVLIHEGRFTYQEQGLRSLQDLGSLWEERTACPLPLGGILVRDDVSSEDLQLFQKNLQNSLERAQRSDFSQLSQVMALYSQEMDPSVMRNHVKLYVNQFTQDLNQEGRHALRRFAEEMGGDFAPERMEPRT